MKVSMVSILLALLSCVATSPLNPELQREAKCPDPEKIGKIALNMTWYESVENWYFPLWNRFGKYKLSPSFFPKKTPGTVDESDIAPPPCLVLNAKKQTLVGWGTSTPYEVTMFPNGRLLQKGDVNGGEGLTAWFYLTDNRHYMIGIDCWEDGYASWASFTSSKTLSKEERGDILTFVEKKLGFNRTFSVDEAYSGCGDI